MRAWITAQLDGLKFQIFNWCYPQWQAEQDRLKHSLAQAARDLQLVYKRQEVFRQADIMEHCITPRQALFRSACPVHFNHVIIKCFPELNTGKLNFDQHYRFVITDQRILDTKITYKKIYEITQDYSAVYWSVLSNQRLMAKIDKTMKLIQPAESQRVAVWRALVRQELDLL